MINPFHPPKTWVLMANSKRAIIVEEASEAGMLKIIQVLRYSEGNQGVTALVADGRSDGAGRAGLPLVGQQDRREVAREQFAEQLATVLEDHLRLRNFSRLIVVAPNPLYGILLKHLKPPVSETIARAIERDMTHLPLSRLRHQLLAA